VIKIINNFFEKNQYNKVINHIKSNIYFTPRFFYNTNEKTEKNYYGDRFVLEEDKNLYNLFKKQAEKKFKLKINKTNDSGIDLRNLNIWQPHTDSDNSKINILIMLDGPVGVTTGTCFFTDDEIDIHVGFRPNRAVMFPSDYYHSPHKSDLKSMRRYTATLFVTEYEEV
tara:strand:+ start:273 stop:779 length:507 start_codon:yes stop_codon:yes gene_type:complete